MSKASVIALAALAGVPTGVDLSSLRDRALSADVVLRLAARGLVTVRTERLDRDPFESTAALVPAAGSGHGCHSLTPEQEEALARLSAMAASRAFATALVHGLMVVSRDEDGCRNTGARVLNPFAKAKPAGT